MSAEAASSRALRMRIAIAIGAVLLMAIGLIVGRVTTPSVTHPTTSSAEAGFARDMQVHHQQAIDMAMTVREQTADPEIRQLAYDIATSQGQQAGQMYAWLNLWGLPQASPSPQMTWMSLPTLDQNTADHGMDMGVGSGSAGSGSGESAGSASDAIVAGAPMPGMASAADLASLGTLTGVDAEKLFLTLMIAHHKGGVEMARALVARSTDANVLALANSIIKAQSSEIGYMTQLLATRS